MKILVLSSHAPTLFFFREDMMKAMIVNGHEVIAAAPEAEEEWVHKFKECNVKYVSILGVERNGMNPIKDIIGFFSILRAIIKEKPDKVFAYQAKTIIYGCIAAKLSGIKEVYAFMGGLGSIFRNKDRKDIVRNILKVEFKTSFYCCNKIFMQNKDDCRELLNNGLIKKNKIIMLNGSGVNFEKFTEKPISQNQVFLLVGRLIKDKGIIEYIEASKIVRKKYPESRMQIVGDFDTNPTAIRKEEINKCVYEGAIEYLGATDDVRPFLEKCSVFVLPSYHEGTPKSVLEAMATGRPIITTDAPGCKETVVDGRNGFLVPIKNVVKLAEKMIWMIEHREEAEKMGQESLRICKEKFDVKKVNEVILKTMNL